MQITTNGRSSHLVVCLDLLVMVSDKTASTRRYQQRNQINASNLGRDYCHDNAHTIILLLHDPLTTTSNEETFLRDFLDSLKQTLQTV